MATGKLVNFSSASGPADGWLVRPGGGRPGMIVVQEWWGLVPHIKNVAARFASQGYVTVAPDLYHGKSTVDAEEASHMLKELDWGRAVEEIAGAIRHLRDSEGVDRIGVAGFCMGGALTILAATLPGVDAYAAFYGFPPAGAADMNRISAAGIIFFGEREEHFSVADAQAFAKKQQAAGRACEVVVYPGAGHAFFNNDCPEAHNPQAANDAWRRTLDHFAKYLRP